MSVKMRMTRMGRRHRPFFRINIVESTSPRDGRIVEKVGHYDPLEKDKAKQIVLKLDRVTYWLDRGAVPSDTVGELLRKQGVKNKYTEERVARRTRARIEVRAKKKPFTKAEKTVIADAQKVAAEEAKKTAADAAKAAKADAAEKPKA